MTILPNREFNIDPCANQILTVSICTQLLHIYDCGSLNFCGLSRESTIPCCLTSLESPLLSCAQDPFDSWFYQDSHTSLTTTSIKPGRTYKHGHVDILESAFARFCARPLPFGVAPQPRRPGCTCPAARGTAARSSG